MGAFTYTSYCLNHKTKDVNIEGGNIVYYSKPTAQQHTQKKILWHFRVHFFEQYQAWNFEFFRPRLVCRPLPRHGGQVHFFSSYGRTEVYKHVWRDDDMRRSSGVNCQWSVLERNVRSQKEGMIAMIGNSIPKIDQSGIYFYCCTKIQNLTSRLKYTLICDIFLVSILHNVDSLKKSWFFFSNQKHPLHKGNHR